MTTPKAFKALHYKETPFLLGNVWDAISTRTYEKLGYPALGTSSAAIASMLGYEDGEQMPFDFYLSIIKRIAANTNLPLSVDLEAGYGSDAAAVASNVKSLIKCGVVGINLEDSHVVDGKRSLRYAEEFASKLKEITERLNGAELFINLRIDTFLLQVSDPIQETKRRIDLYKNYIDGVFLPCIVDEAAIKSITDSTDLPLNVMSMPDLPDFKTLQALKVKRISSGNFLQDHIMNVLKDQATSIHENQSFRSLFEAC